MFRTLYFQCTGGCGRKYDAIKIKDEYITNEGEEKTFKTIESITCPFCGSPKKIPLEGGF